MYIYKLNRKDIFILSCTKSKMSLFNIWLKKKFSPTISSVLYKKRTGKGITTLPKLDVLKSEEKVHS